MAKWRIVDDTEHFVAKCSECGKIVDSRLLYYDADKYLFCPKCKSKMENPKRRAAVDRDFEPISDKHLLALHMMCAPQKDSLSFFADVYAAVSELIERRKTSGEWRGLIDDGHKRTD